MEVIKVGEGSEESFGFKGKVHKKPMKRMEAMRFINNFQKAIKEDAVSGTIYLVDELAKVFTKIDLKHEDKTYKSVDDLFEIEAGEKFISEYLTKKIVNAVVLPKN